MPGAHGGSQLPLFSLTIMESVLDAIHARYAPVDARVAEILENIRRDCRALERESRNQGNERQVEEFIDRLRAEFGERVVIERQRLSAWAVRTTRWNYLFTVRGDSTDRIVLVAHYDTWRGPGADDNTTGEEIVKQYLLADLRAARRPALTHTYFLAGSEECGLVGLSSQLLLTLLAVVAVEIAILLYMMARRIQTWIDNAYRHENRADNLGSLRRVRDQTLR